MKYLWGIAFGLVLGVLGAGLLLLASRQPSGEPVQLSPPPTEAPLMVHVIGAVLQPGVYSLPPGSRVQDAIQAAGGPTKYADTAGLNLVAELEDGVQIWLPTIKSELADEGNPTLENLQSHEEEVQSLVDINNATQVELERLPGIGPTKAEAILQYRQENGPFKEVEQLLDISGIGPATLERLKSLITVGGIVQD